MSYIRSSRYRQSPGKSWEDEVKAGGFIYTFMPKWRIAACIIHEHTHENLSQFRCSPVEQPLSHLR